MGEICDQHSGVCSGSAATEKRLLEHIQDNKEAHSEMWAAINCLRNRLPVWATVAIAILTGAIGWLANINTR